MINSFWSGTGFTSLVSLFKGLRHFPYHEIIMSWVDTVEDLETDDNGPLESNDDDDDVYGEWLCKCTMSCVVASIPMDHPCYHTSAQYFLHCGV